MYYVYTVDGDGRLTGVISMRDLILSGPGTKLAAVARKAVAVGAETDQEEVARLLRKHGYLGLPVADSQHLVLGLITADDVAEVAEEEATEDIQKLGGSAALAVPYLSVGFPDDPQAWRLAVRSVPRRNAHGDRDGILRGRDRAGGRTRAVRAAHHQ